VAALSVGKVKGEILADLCYEEDAAAEVDCNVVMNDKGEYIELQGTGESGTFLRGELEQLLDIAESGIGRLVQLQKDCLELSEAEREAFL